MLLKVTAMISSTGAGGVSRHCRCGRTAAKGASARTMATMASPTTAGKGCDPLYDNAGGGRVAGSRPPQAQSQDRPMNTPTRRIGITTQFALQPTVENVTTESFVVNCPSNVAPEAVFE